MRKGMVSLLDSTHLSSALKGSRSWNPKKQFFLTIGCETKSES